MTVKFNNISYLLIFIFSIAIQPILNISVPALAQITCSTPPVVYLYDSDQAIQKLWEIERGNLASSDFSGDDFKALVECDDPAPLITLLNSNDSDVRGIAAYVLGEIFLNISKSYEESGHKNEIAHKNLVVIRESIWRRESIETNVDVLDILYSLGPMRVDPEVESNCGKVEIICDKDGACTTQITECVALPILEREIQKKASSPVICRLPGIAKIFPRCQ